MSNNFLSSLIASLSTATGGSAATIASTISSAFASKFASIETTISTLQGIGPGLDPADAQRVALINQVTNALAAISTTPTAVYGLVGTLKGLIGKNDASSMMLWGQICSQINSDLNSVSTSLL